ncbi:MAG: alpha/beta hydrolase-fold protein, partial [Flavobacteriaceae bacterium]|nr:alpha/beta hydrolase-fold protein [Flavobacteriaceae bacterium]
MRRLLIFSLFALFSFSSISQTKGDITIGKIDSLDSEILGENRKIWIHVPDTNPNSIYTKQNFPVIYLLDGPGHFTSVVGMMQHLSGSSIAPKMIVVGIPNTNRTRDLTPSKAKLDPPMIDERIVRDSGGGKKFMAFLEQELIPYI